MRIYVVIGMTGEYSDHRDWLVRAFASETRAQEFVDDVSRVARELYSSVNRYDGHKLRGKNHLDPNMDCDYNGVRYHYCEVELEKEEWQDF